MIAVTQVDDEIYACDTENRKQSVYNAMTGEKIRGDLEMDGQEVLYRKWAQTQSSLNEKQLREKWRKMNEGV